MQKLKSALKSRKAEVEGLEIRRKELVSKMDKLSDSIAEKHQTSLDEVDELTEAGGEFYDVERKLKEARKVVCEIQERIKDLCGRN